MGIADLGAAGRRRLAGARTWGVAAVEGGVGPNKAAPSRGDLRLPEQDEALYWVRMRWAFDFLRARHTAIMARLGGRAQGSSSRRRHRDPEAGSGFAGSSPGPSCRYTPREEPPGSGPGRREDRHEEERAGRGARAGSPRVHEDGGVATAALLAQGALPRSGQASPEFPQNPATAGAMPTRNLGRTGYQVGIFSLGGQSALERANNDAVAVPIVERALDLGVNYIDTSSIYGGPERWSERYIGQVMKRRRSRGLPRQQDQGAHPRRLAADAGDSRSKLLKTDHLDLLAAPRPRHDGRHRGGLREGRRDGGAHPGAASRGW